ncbi:MULTISPECIES: hypothetical protein [unclassified Streptomyces]|uniref:hypothetical protein n=1 Tax=unclassified Streptomyces TaxID=2593676 RepID=UPI00117E6970|nr:hypothetical protein [Streptomyces sp. CB01883]
MTSVSSRGRLNAQDGELERAEEELRQALAMLSETRAATVGTLRVYSAVMAMLKPCTTAEAVGRPWPGVRPGAGKR